LIIATLLEPIFNNIDKAKFEKLDTQSRALYEEVKAASGGAEMWTYEASCALGGSGGFQAYSQYNCETNISMEAKASSVDQLNALHAKYYTVFDGSTSLKQKTALNEQYPRDFGVRFVRSSADKQYVSSDGNVTCTYLGGLSDGNDVPYGTELSVDKAFVTINLTCFDKARGNWYN